MSDDSKAEIDRMLRNSQTKVIAPVLTLGILCAYSDTHDPIFSDTRIRQVYTAAVKQMQAKLGHSVHIGAKYYDAYGSRMSRYGVLEQVAHLQYRLLPPFLENASELCAWIPHRIADHIRSKLGIVPLLQQTAVRVDLAESRDRFLNLIQEQISRNPSNFEIFTFAIMKVHLEKFACKLYRDTRTAARDRGVDISTNFGVVYQVKKLRIHTEAQASQVYAELKGNFDSGRLSDGNVVLVVDDISQEFRQFLINMKVQAISTLEVLRLAAGFAEAEDRQKVLRVAFEEFSREYSGRLG